MKIKVYCYEGYKARETPRILLLGERRIEVIKVVDRWRGEDHEYVKLTGSDGNLYIIRYSAGSDEWELVLMRVEPPVH